MPETGPGPAWVIRRAGPKDAEAFADAAERFFRQTYGHDPVHSAVMDSHCRVTFDPPVILAQLTDAQTVVKLALVAESIVGIGQVRMREDRAEVLRLYLAPDWHGKGLAQALLAEMTATAREFGASVLQLGVWEGNERALSFYRRQGFRVVGQTPFLLNGHPMADVLMQRAVV